MNPARELQEDIIAQEDHSVQFLSLPVSSAILKYSSGSTAVIVPVLKMAAGVGF